MILRPYVLFVLSLALWIVGCGDSKPVGETDFFEPQTAGCKKQAIADEFLVQWKTGETTLERAPSAADFKEHFFAEHKNEIQFAEHNYQIRIDPVPDMPVSTMGLAPEDWGQVDSEATWAWQNGLEGKDVIVAVIDSGADFSHPQLENQVYVNSREPLDGIDNDGNGYVDDISGWDFVHSEKTLSGDMTHGTHVSGIVLAEHSKGQVKGMAPKAKLLPLKFIDNDLGSIDLAIFAIDYAVGIAKRENKPLVLNASWGSAGCSLNLSAKMDSFNSRRVLFAVAAGNDGRSLSTKPMYPAAFSLDSQITVGAYSNENVLTTFSNFGPLVNLAAPGLDIFSTYPVTQGSYKTLRGTSMATPFVAGAAALLWGYKPTATTAQIKNALLNSVEDESFNVKSKGKLNVRKAKLLLDQM